MNHIDFNRTSLQIWDGPTKHHGSGRWLVAQSRPGYATFTAVNIDAPTANVELLAVQNFDQWQWLGHAFDLLPYEPAILAAIIAASLHHNGSDA